MKRLPAVLLLTLSTACKVTSPVEVSVGLSFDVASSGPAWSSLSALPVPVRAAAATTLGDRVFVLGGNDAQGASRNDVQVFQISRNRWHQWPAFNGPRDFAMAATIGTTIHLVGGANPNRLSDHQVLRANRDVWETRAPLPLAVDAAVAHVVDGKLFIIGGSPVNGMATDAVQIYDPATDAWSFGTSMPTERLSAASGVLRGWIYVAGGQPSGIVTTGAVERYHPGEDTWEYLPPLPAPREALAGGIVGGRFCVFGGRIAEANPTGNAFPETWCFGEDLRQWIRGPDMLTPRVEAAAAQLVNGVLLAGGRTPTVLASGAVEAIRR